MGKFWNGSINIMLIQLTRNFLLNMQLLNLLKELDPHSSYLTKEEVAQLNEPLQGNFEGIGVSFNILNDTSLYYFTHIRGTI